MCNFNVRVDADEIGQQVSLNSRGVRGGNICPIEEVILTA